MSMSIILLTDPCVRMLCEQLCVPFVSLWSHSTRQHAARYSAGSQQAKQEHLPELLASGTNSNTEGPEKHRAICANTQGKGVLNTPSIQTLLFHIKTRNLTAIDTAKPGMLCAFLLPKLQLTMGSKFWDSPPVKDQRTGELHLRFRRGAAPPLHLRALQGRRLCKPRPICQLSALPAAIHVSTGDWEILFSSPSHFFPS